MCSFLQYFQQFLMKSHKKVWWNFELNLKKVMFSAIIKLLSTFKKVLSFPNRLVRSHKEIEFFHMFCLSNIKRVIICIITTQIMVFKIRIISLWLTMLSVLLNISILVKDHFDNTILLLLLILIILLRPRIFKLNLIIVNLNQ